MKKTALLSAFNKTNNFLDFSKNLFEMGWRLLGSKGSADFLKNNGVECEDISKFVGDPIFGHRVVSLSREIHAGLLATLSAEDQKELEKLGIPYIDLVYVDLYPLQAEISNPDHTFESVIEKTDIGGPTMLRSAAKGRRIAISDERQIAGIEVLLRETNHLSREELATHEEYQNFVTICASAAESTVANYCFISGEFLRTFIK